MCLEEQRVGKTEVLVYSNTGCIWWSCFISCVITETAGASRRNTMNYIWKISVKTVESLRRLPSVWVSTSGKAWLCQEWTQVRVLPLLLLSYLSGENMGGCLKVEEVQYSVTAPPVWLIGEWRFKVFCGPCLYVYLACLTFLSLLWTT